MSQISERKCRTSDCLDQNRRFDEYGNYGENNPPVAPAVENDRKDIRPMTEEERQRAKEREAANQTSVDTWHYQLMYHKVDMKSFVDGGYYAIHEYYPMKDGDGWTEAPVVVDGESVEEVKEVLQMMLEDIEKHGVKDYE